MTATGPSVSEVDDAVRSVLAELVSAVRRNGVGAGAAAGGRDVFAGRLLSLSRAEALPAGAREVRVAPGTVVTPLARDHLKRLGVEIRFVARAEVDRARNVGEWAFAIESGSGVVEAFRRSLLDGADVWNELGSSLDDAARWAADGGARGALVLADEASVAVYRAGRVAGVRAASASEPDAVARAARALGVNLLVVEPAGKSIALLRQIAATFRRAGGPVAPGWIDDRHGGPSR